MTQQRSERRTSRLAGIFSLWGRGVEKIPQSCSKWLQPMCRTFPRRQHAFQFALIVALALGYTAFVCMRLLDRASLDNYLRDLTVNDSYYYYQIARNFAEGRFSTADGINPTNGYHPLWAWLLTPVFWFEHDPVRALGSLKLVEFALLGAATVAALSWALTLRMNLWSVTPALVVFLGSDSLTRGMEGAAAALNLCVVLCFAALAGRFPSKRWVWVGLSLSLALLPWARLELIAVSFVVVLGLLLLFWRGELRCPWRWQSYLGLTFAFVVAYFGLELMFFSTPVPVSGQLKVYWSEILMERNNVSLLDNFRAHFENERYRAGLLLTLGTLVTIALSWSNPVYRRHGYRVDHLCDAFMLGLGSFAVGRFVLSSILLVPQYSRQDWYFAPLLVYQVLFWPYAIYRLHRLAGAAGMRGRTVLTLASLLYLTNFDWLQAEDHLQQLTRHSNQVDWEIGDYRALSWVRRELPEGAIVGSTDSGVFGFFGGFTVVNLDGLANSTEFFHSTRDQDLENWLVSHQVTHFLNSVPNKHKVCDVMRRRMRQERRFTTPCQLLREGPGSRGRKVRLWRFNARP